MSTVTVEPVVRDEVLDAALAWAQEFGFNGDRLPQGERCTAGRCPLANATGMNVTPDYARFREGNWGTVDLPPPGRGVRQSF